MSAQLALNLRLRDSSSFDNFFPGDNRELVDSLRGMLSRRERGRWLLFLWGEAATGKTHLLEATCRLADEQGRRAAYVSFASADGLVPAMLEDLDQVAVACLDDIERVAGDAVWEQALFRLWERMSAAGGLLVVAASAAPARLGLGLPDLATRLAAGLVYQVKPLSDDEKLEALARRARNRGLDLPVEVARYILNRYPRDSSSLFGLLERADRAAFANQRRLTIPFLRALEASAAETPR
jgi:DnaA family protein